MGQSHDLHTSKQSRQDFPAHHLISRREELIH
jgi:hypothetical protein